MCKIHCSDRDRVDIRYFWGLPIRRIYVLRSLSINFYDQMFGFCYCFFNSSNLRSIDRSEKKIKKMWRRTSGLIRVLYTNGVLILRSIGIFFFFSLVSRDRSEFLRKKKNSLSQRKTTKFLWRRIQNFSLKIALCETMSGTNH